MLQEGDPESAPMPPPDRSRQGVLSDGVVPVTTSRLLILSDEFTVLLYVTFGSVGCWFSTVTSPDPDTSTLRPWFIVSLMANVVTHEEPAVSVRPRQLNITSGRSELA